MVFIQEEVEEGNSGGEVNISNSLIIIVIIIALNQVKKTCFDHMNKSSFHHRQICHLAREAYRPPWASLLK